MNNLQYLGYIAFLGVLVSASTVSAQTPASTTAQVFTPRVGVRYTTEGAGYESFSSFEGFLPVLQIPGNSLTFLQGKLLLDNDSNLATNILLGHRIFSEEANRVIGGYISYSTRDTGKSNFDQLGLGFETLGVWDFRFNAYLPLNGSENQVEQANLPFFQGDSLMVQRSRFLEVAMSGVDAEVGTRLASLGSGDLRGYAGVYYYSGGESREAFGWKTRIEARPNDFLGFSLSLQNDDLFDTRLVFSIGANFPGSGARRGKPSKNSALTRMAQSVDNQATILVAVENRTDVFAAMVEPEEEGSTNSIDTPTNNTDNSEQLIIIHVAPGGTGNGTFESPYGSIAQALAVAKADNVIYVRSDENTVFPPFTIPNDVRVFSSSPVQVVNVKGLGIVTLPLSGSGIHPTITGTVNSGNGLITLGNNSVISGFNLQVAGNEGARGIQGINISNVIIDNNKISNPFGEGIYLENIAGTTIIHSNTINNVVGNAINLSQVSTTEITNNLINNITGTGILLTNVSDTSSITNNTISNTTGDGIQLSQVISPTITNNSITNSGNRGIFIENSTGTINISDNTLTDNNQEAIKLTEVTGTTTINQNTINGSNNSTGIDIANTTGDINLTIANNNLSENFNDIRVDLSTTTGTLQINNNIISNHGTAIDLQLVENTNLTNATINNNQITGTATSTTSQGIHLQAYDNAAIGDFEVSDNTISNMTNGDGTNFQLNGSSTATFNIAGNTISNIQDTDPGDFNFTEGINVEVFDNAKAEITVANNNISQVPVGNGIYMQFAGGDNAGSIDITDNTISQITTEGNGIDLQFFDNFDSNTNINTTVNIARNNISDIQGTGINAFNETPDNTIIVTVDQNTISNSSGDGINLNGVNNAQVINNNITNAGEQGIQVENANGTINVDSNTITDAQQESISLSEVTGTVSVSQNIVNGNNNHNGITITNIQGESNLLVNGNTLTENFNDIRVSLSNTTGTVEINNNIIENSGTAIDLQLGENTNLTNATINNNQITGTATSTTSQGINLQAYDNAAIGDFEVSGNTISNMTNGDGTNFQLNGSSTATFNIAGNTISNIQDTISNSFRDGINLNGVNNAQVINNNITNAGEQGIQVENANGTINVDSNTITDAQQESISLSEVTGTVSVSQNIANGNNNHNGIAIANTSSTTNLTVNSNQLTENFNDIRVSLSDTIGTLQINDNTISNNGTAMDVQLGANTNLTSVSLNNNQITGVDADITSSGINLQAFDNVVAGNVTAAGNTINTITNGDGMNFQLNGTSTATFQIATNIISNIRDTDAGDANFTDGINFEIFDAAGSTVELSNNVIDQIQGYGISITIFSSGSVNVTISNDNQITNTQDGEVFIAP
ncbi:hypothetical protein NIES23_59960 (plasmid) [Trichormus variabilis NIES-23]|uniref:Right handed beta helix domain-containing protein n=1 Tax=Trichormus variabilis NIES-23 TaxID=1973479 RepID=A0A1Z4KW78_ANAVA|nr:hypothetical protein NIES23_59960 [Trichormus variabilis NIES-23]